MSYVQLSNDNVLKRINEMSNILQGNRLMSKKFLVQVSEIILYDKCSLTSSTCINCLKNERVMDEMLFFFNRACSMRMFPGQGLNQPHARHPSRCRDDAGFMTSCTRRELQNALLTRLFMMNTEWLPVYVDFKKYSTRKKIILSMPLLLRHREQELSVIRNMCLWHFYR